MPPEIRLALFRLVLLQRLTEERIVSLYLQGRIPGSVYTGRGQEGVAAAAGLALGPEDVVAPVNREMACHLARGVTVADVLRNYLGRGTGPTQGRDGNMHFGARDRDIFPLVSMLGSLVPVTVGAALAFKRRNEARVALTFFGDGTMSTGDVHEGLNLAAVLQRARGLRPPEQRLRVLDADRAPDAQHQHGRARARRLGHSRRARRRHRRARRLRHRARRDRAGARRRRAAGRRSAYPADARSRGPRRRPLHGQGAAAHVRRPLRPRRAARGPPAARRTAASTRSTRCGSAAADEVASGLAEAEAAPAPDPATLADGVYAMPPEGTDDEPDQRERSRSPTGRSSARRPTSTATGSTPTRATRSRC